MTGLEVRTSDRSRDPPRMRWAGWGLLAAATMLLVWILVLGASLPTTASAQHWRVAWIGLDVMETTALAVTGWLVLRRDARVTLAASAAAAFLLADGWFDITTAQPTWDVLRATVLALFVELPLVVLCTALAISASRRCVDSDRPG